MKSCKLTVVVLVASMFSVSARGQDECMTAITPGVPVDLCDMTATGSDPFPSCGTGDGTLTAWYSFVATDTQARIRTDINSTGTDSTYAVYSGECGGLSEIGCSEDEAGFLGDICVDGLTVGDTYHVMLMPWTDGGCGVYQVDVETKADTCGNGVVDSPCEECDGTDDAACPWLCQTDCKCSTTIVSSISLEQITYDSDHTGFVPYTEYGHFIVFFRSHPLLWQIFLSVVADTGDNLGWLVQNMPLLGEDIVGGGQQEMSALVDLGLIGVNRGDNMEGTPFTYAIVLSKDPLEVMPSVTPMQTGVIGART